MVHNFKSMQSVPTAKDFIDIVLSKTQRGTPTVVHNGAQPFEVAVVGACVASGRAAVWVGAGCGIQLCMPKQNAVAACAVRCADLLSVLCLPSFCSAGWAIQRIRQFYMRKVKFTQQNWHDKLTQILDDFPKARAEWKDGKLPCNLAAGCCCIWTASPAPLWCGCQTASRPIWLPTCLFRCRRWMTCTPSTPTS